MTKEPKVMLGMSFFKGSFDLANTTAEAFAKSLWNGNQVVIGIETDGLHKNTVEIKKFCAQRKKERWGQKVVYGWDDSCDSVFFPKWTSNLAKPFYQKGFSYGGATNKLLTLAKIAECKYLIRIDPGTAPPYYFKEMLYHHTTEIVTRKEVDVVSGMYSDRIALRHDFIPDHKKRDYYDFIHVFTGINPDRQLTGGAALTIDVTTGPPSISFPGFTPVWGSDDGLYETITEGRVLILPESRVLRTDPGTAARQGSEYPVRLASMVVARQLLAKSPKSVAVDAGYEFLDRLHKQYYCKYILAEAKAKMKERLPNIVKGCKNYPALKKNWPRIIKTAAALDNKNCQVRW